MGLGRSKYVGLNKLIPEITDQMILRKLGTEDPKTLIQNVALKSYICVPIKTRTAIIGTLTIVTTDESNRKYGTNDVILAEELGTRAGYAIENARLYIESLSLNRIKDEFLANLSHELRTPMNVIQGNAEILLTEALNLLPDELKESVQAIARNAQIQTSIIGDLLEVSSIITGKVSYKPVMLSPAEILNDVIENLRPTAQAKGVTLILENSETPQSISADPTRLRQIFWNLVSNAIKFTNRGGHVKVAVMAATLDWCFTVQDTGRGIDPDFLPYVFDRFRQEDATTTKRYGGLGLGLSIVRYLVELHGGSVKAESDGVGEGAKFTVSLPLPSDRVKQEYRKVDPKMTENQTVSKAQAGINLENVKVLLIEDSADNLILIHRVLAKAGAIVVDSESAAEARVKLEKFIPDVIVSDIGMPDENGIEFIKKLRSLGTEQVRSIPAIAVTAYVREEEKQATLSAGFQAHVPKPVTASALLGAIDLLLRH